jgi:hypothetical protein
MENYYQNFEQKKILKSLIFLFFFFAFIGSVNSQTISANTITAPAKSTGYGSIDPDVIKGSTVTVTNSGVSTCNFVTYEWESASDISFSKDVVHKLAITKDYDPGLITKTIYFRRTASVECTNPDCSASSTCSGIKITVL